jgi:2-haloacid dehalogenase
VHFLLFCYEPGRNFMKPYIHNIIFDLGGVLIDWNPRYLYRKFFNTEEEITWFLENICTAEWNEIQDAGRSFSEATEELVKKHPAWEEPIRAWYGRWTETIQGSVADTVEILKYFKESPYHKIYALTNWSAESFPVAFQMFDFLQWFDGIVVSGVEKTRKPFPDIYHLLLNRYNLKASETLFIDDNMVNVKGAEAAGIHALHFETPQKLRDDLIALGLM